MTDYNQIEYWDNRVYPCYKATVEKLTPIQIKCVKEQLSGCKKILDFGPGFGRMFPAYKDAEEVTGHDITSNYKNQIIEESKKHSFKFDFHISQHIDKINFPDKHFDVAVAIEVLLHQIPENIITIMSELNRVADKVIIITWMDLNKKLGRDESMADQYCFNYNYVKICEENNWKMMNYKIYHNQLYFVFKGE